MPSTPLKALMRLAYTQLMALAKEAGMETPLLTFLAPHGIEA
jgi:hypothetical protein